MWCYLSYYLKSNVCMKEMHIILLKTQIEIFFQVTKIY
jgi:hypothetical protein